MAQHQATIEWQRGDAAFSDGRYSRGHRWLFDGGVEVKASSAPDVLPPPMSVVEAVDPEEALVAALSSCHMLWFLAIAAKQKFVVDSYRDEAIGEMGKNELGRVAMMRITLRPRATFSGDRQPSREELAAMHHSAHEKCYIANSVRSEVRLEPE